MGPTTLTRGARGATLSRFAMLVMIAIATGDCRPVEAPGCLASSDPACVVPSVCGRLTYACAGGFVRVRRMTAADFARAGGLDAEAAIGDWILENDQLSAVIDDVGEPHALAPTGGTLIDLAPRGGGDHLNQLYQVTGILPRDAAHYERIEQHSMPDRAMIVARGRLDGDANVQVVTTYELRSCDRGVRIRTELYNNGGTAWTSFLADGLFWGDRSMTPFVPIEGRGFRQPTLSLTDPDAVWARFPWVAASSHASPYASYAIVACDRPLLEGIHDPTISAVGLPRTIVDPGAGIALERIVLVGAGQGIGAVQPLAIDAHARLHFSAFATVRGRAVFSNGQPAGSDGRVASLHFYEPARASADGRRVPTSPDDPDMITPWSEVVPDADGSFTVTLPAQRSFRVRVHQLGRAVGEAREFSSGAGQGSVPVVDLGMIPVRLPARLTVRAFDAMSMQPLIAEAIFVPTGTTRPDDVAGTTHGYFERCAPYLGPAHAGSPACNRAVFQGDSGPIAVAPGTYHVYVTAGPNRSLTRRTFTLAEGANETYMALLQRTTAWMPAGSLSGDFHVHGGRSFDTAFPDRDRVLTFVASDVDVIAATEHDSSSNFADAIRDLGVGDRVTVMSGTESTPLIPFFYPPGSRFPRVVGHMIAWPIPFDATRPRNGAPWDELMQPGQLFDRLRPIVGTDGVIQLNHPNAASKVGRDEGYARVLRFDPRVALPGRDDGTAIGMLYQTPGGAGRSRNIDYDTQEAMNGPDLLHNLQYRLTWFTFLNHGILRAGTANSDSHSMRANILGYPRNIVLGTFDRARFDAAAFNRAVREGRMLGTNGPLVDARIVSAGQPPQLPGLAAARLMPGATLEISVRAPAWVPVTEIRIVVNGRVARTVGTDRIRTPAAALDAIDAMDRYTGSFPVAELLGGRDGWIVVEAGLPIPATTDRHCASEDPDGTTPDDGLPDCADGNGDGRVEETELSPPAETDPRFHIDVVSPGTLPWGFTNPFVIDIDGNGWSPPGGTL